MKRTSPAARITVGAMSAAIGVLFMFAASAVPAGKLALLFLASLVIWIPLNSEKGLLHAFLVYIATGAITFLIVPDKKFFIIYALFFGIFGMGKYIIEKFIKDKFLVFFVKLIVCNVFAGAYILLTAKLFEIDIITLLPALPLYVLIPLMEIAFVAYDLVYTMCAKFFDDKLRKYITPPR